MKIAIHPLTNVKSINEAHIYFDRYTYTVLPIGKYRVGDLEWLCEESHRVIVRILLLPSVRTIIIGERLAHVYRIDHSHPWHLIAYQIAYFIHQALNLKEEIEEADPRELCPEFFREPPTE